MDFRKWLWRDMNEKAIPRQQAKPGLDWVIVGSESGPQSRCFHLDWARTTCRHFLEAGIPVFIKQLGACATEVRLYDMTYSSDDMAWATMKAR